MKKFIIAGMVAMFVMGYVSPVFAASAPTPTKDEQQLKAKLSQVKRKQKSTAVKINRDVTTAKKKLVVVKKQRATEKAKRAKIKSGKK